MIKLCDPFLKHCGGWAIIATALATYYFRSAAGETRVAAMQRENGKLRATLEQTANRLAEYSARSNSILLSDFLMPGALVVPTEMAWKLAATEGEYISVIEARRRTEEANAGGNSRGRDISLNSVWQDRSANLFNLTSAENVSLSLEPPPDTAIALKIPVAGASH